MLYLEVGDKRAWRANECSSGDLTNKSLRHHRVRPFVFVCMLVSAHKNYNSDCSANGSRKLAC
jgi:hypothetical protein